MPTSFLKGDLFHHRELRAFGHGCNCAGAMGKGIAVEFRARYPKMYAEYKKRCEDGRFKPGDVFSWDEGDVTIFNLGTQETWRTKADIGAIGTSVRAMIRLAERKGLRKIGLPRIGSGLGGLPWEPIRTLLGDIGNETTIELIVFEEYLPADESASKK